MNTITDDKSMKNDNNNRWQKYDHCLQKPVIKVWPMITISDDKGITNDNNKRWF